MQYPLTDTIIILILIYHFFVGWQKGLLETLLGPISFLIASVASYIYYQQSHNLLFALLIGILGPIVIHVIYAIFKTLTKKKDEKKPFELSLPRFLAGLIHSLWSLAFLALVLALIVFLPVKNQNLYRIQNNISDSKSYKVLQAVSGNRLPKKALDPNKIKTSMNNPTWMKKYQSTKEYVDLIKDDCIKEILNDESIQKEIQNNNFVSLLNNPKVQEIIQDKDLLEKFIKLNKKMAELSDTQ